jgi:large subunit ribosomal protein L21e
MKRSGGKMRKTRHLSRRGFKEQGKISLARYFQMFTVGEKVTLLSNSAVSKGHFYSKFHGKSGIIKEARGQCYEVMVKDGAAEKMVIAHPIHLRKAKV